MKSETKLVEDLAENRLASDATPGALSVGVILASVREGRKGEVFAKWICEQMAARSGMRPELLDLREWALLSHDGGSPPLAAERHFPDGSLGRRWVEKLQAIDAFVIVTPEYNHGYPGSLKTALDSVYSPWNYKPVTFVSYGYGASGARAVEQLRQIAIELRMVPIRDEVNLGLGGYAADGNGFPVDDAFTKRASIMLDGLLWWARLMKEARTHLPR